MKEAPEPVCRRLHHIGRIRAMGVWAHSPERFLALAGFFDANGRLSSETTWLNAEPSEYHLLADRP